MNKLRNLVLLAFVAILIGMAAAPATAATKSDAALRAQAKISEQTASKTALAQVPGGRIKSAELERENGLLVWSFDISMAKSKDITEVQVDAGSGKVVSQEIETPSDQAKEAAADSK